MTDDTLKAQLERAVEAEDFEEAARLRDLLLAGSQLRRQTPGKMGLGTDQPAHIPPPGWTPPPRPEPLTSRSVKRRGRS